MRRALLAALFLGAATAALAFLDGELHPAAGLPGRPAGHLLDVRPDTFRIGPLPPLRAVHLRVAPIRGDGVGVLGDGPSESKTLRE